VASTCHQHPGNPHTVIIESKPF